MPLFAYLIGILPLKTTIYKTNQIHQTDETYNTDKTDDNNKTDKTKNWAEKVVDRKWGDNTKKNCMLLLKLAGLLPTAKNSSPFINLSLPGVVQKNIESQLFGCMSSRIPAELWFEA